MVGTSQLKDGVSSLFFSIIHDFVPFCKQFEKLKFKKHSMSAFNFVAFLSL